MTANVPTKTPRRIGRPPAGARAGERVKDYPQLSVRLPVDTRATLQALSLVVALPQWRIVTDAIDCYLRGRPDAVRRQVERIAARIGAKTRRS